MSCWRNCYSSRRKSCAAKRSFAGKSKTWKPCATCFFPSGKNRETTANRHAGQSAGQVASGIHSQEAVCGGGGGSGGRYYQDRGRQNAASAAYQDWRKGNLHQRAGRGAAGGIHRPGGTQRERYSHGYAFAADVSSGLPTGRRAGLLGWFDACESAAGGACGDEQSETSGTSAAYSAGSGCS